QLEEELRPLAIHLIASFVWSRVRRDRRPRLLVIDEAWSLLRYPEGGAFISDMARRARKYYLGLVTITQDVADFLSSPHGRAVLVNAAMKVLSPLPRVTGPPAEHTGTLVQTPVEAGRSSSQPDSCTVPWSQLEAKRPSLATTPCFHWYIRRQRVNRSQT